MAKRKKTGGEILSAWRAAQNPPLTQKQLGEILGVKQNTISGWECDHKVPPSQAMRVALLKKAGVPLDAWVCK